DRPGVRYGQHLAVRTKGDQTVRSTPANPLDFLPCLHLAEGNGSDFRSRCGEDLSIGRKTQGNERSRKLKLSLARGNGPAPAPVFSLDACGSQALAIRGEGESVPLPLVGFPPAQSATASRIPQGENSGPAVIEDRGRQRFAIEGQGDGQQGGPLRVNAADLLAGRDIPDMNHASCAAGQYLAILTEGPETQIPVCEAELADPLARRHLPHGNRPRAPTRAEGSAIGRERHHG